jgi:hypothetical protein
MFVAFFWLREGPLPPEALPLGASRRVGIEAGVASTPESALAPAEHPSLRAAAHGLSLQPLRGRA